ncbi:MAG: LarC family nickel insertion protein [Desulfarculus sp.]|nr:LarC family nickel insertion protein [Desulfarculus sp.]
MEAHDVTVLSTVVDDMNPELLAPLLEDLLALGAWEATFTPTQTKKNRPAVRLEVVCRPDLAHVLAETVLEQTSSLGVRVRQEQRWCLARRPGRVTVLGQSLAGKWAQRPSGRWEFKPEYDACLDLARSRGLSLGEVWRAALVAAQAAAGPEPGSA